MALVVQAEEAAAGGELKESKITMLMRARKQCQKSPTLAAPEESDVL
jgi:hypothetical protein